MIENIFVRNVEVGECKEAVLKINLQYENREKCDRSFPPIVRNVFMDRITSDKSDYGVLIVGYDDRTNIENIHVTNSKFEQVSKSPVSVKGAKDVNFENLFINGQLVTK